MWFNNPREKEVKRRSNLSFRILNGYENINRNMFSHQRKIVELDDMKGSVQIGYQEVLVFTEDNK